MRSSAEQVKMEEFENLRRSHRRTRVLLGGAILLCAGILLSGFTRHGQVQPWRPVPPWGEQPVGPTPPLMFFDEHGVARLEIEADGIRLFDPSGEKMQAILRTTPEGGLFVLFDRDGNVVYQLPGPDVIFRSSNQGPSGQDRRGQGR